MSLPDGYVDLPAGKLANVVTCLEMFDRPVARAQPPGPIGALTRVERPDLGWYRRLFRRVGEPYLWFSRLTLSDEQLTRVVNDPLVEVYAVEADGDEIGFVELDFRIDGECEIVFLGIVESALGRGLGRWLMDLVLERAWGAHPIRRLWLHTCSFDHAGALPFYVRSGFRPYKRQIEICDDPRLRGLLPRTAAPHVPLL
jgi:GNAT superfamily N-acetyltransferase